MKTSTKFWLHGLGSAIVTGLSTSFLSALGINGANSVGVTIPSLSWRQLAVLTVIGGAVGAAAYLKQSPLPDEDPPEGGGGKGIMGFFLCFILAFGLLAFGGCATVPAGDDQGARAAAWVADRAGYIQAATKTAAEVAIYSVEKDDPKREEIRATVHAVAANLNALVTAGKVDPEAVRGALKVKEAYFNGILSAVANLYAAEYQNVKRNGYAALMVGILKAVSAGVSDATGGE